MVIFQNSLADIFQTITLVNHDLTRNNSEENSQERFDLTKNACKQFVSYLYHKSRYQEKLETLNPSLAKYEIQICEALGSDLTASDESVKRVSEAVGEIQKSLLDLFPPESEEWKFLLGTFPQLRDFRPE